MARSAGGQGDSSSPPIRIVLFEYRGQGQYGVGQRVCAARTTPKLTPFIVEVCCNLPHRILEVMCQ